MKTYKVLLVVAFLFSQVTFAKTRVLFLGDSLTEGYGIDKSHAYPFLVEQRLKNLGKHIEAINAGITGSTTASAKSRLQWQLKNKPDILVLALGANDGLRGINVKISQKQLTETVQLAKTNGITVLLVGMKLPPNFGPAYAKSFEKMFEQIAQSEKVYFLPFLLEGVGGVPSLNLSDGIHPNEKGHSIIADTVVKALQKLL